FLVAWYLVWQDSGFPAVNFDAWNNAGSFNQHVNVQSNHATLIRQIDAASTVLLKNTNSVLPLKALKTIALIGNGAANSFRGANGYVAGTRRLCDSHSFFPRYSDRGGDDGVLAVGE
ncbi:hypothetical protein B0H14DRAFT_2424809, partial [Mycena olivaceomarginata]